MTRYEALPQWRLVAVRVERLLTCRAPTVYSAVTTAARTRVIHWIDLHPGRTTITARFCSPIVVLRTDKERVVLSRPYRTGGDRRRPIDGGAVADSRVLEPESPSVIVTSEPAIREAGRSRAG